MTALRRLLSLADRDERGVSAVEFALVVIPIFLLLLGVFDFGLGIWTYNNLAEATDEGARFAIVRGQAAKNGSGTSIEVGPTDTDSPPDGIDNFYQEGPVPCSSVTSEKVVPVVCQYAFPLDPSKLTVTVQWGCNVGGNPDNCSGLSNSINQLMRVEAHYVYAPFVNNLFPLTINLRSVSRMTVACCD